MQSTALTLDARVPRRLVGALVALVVVLATLVVLVRPSGASATQSVKLVLGWTPDPESGGWYAAQQEGLYAKNGLNVTLVPGGPQVSATQLVASGKAQFGIGDAEQVIEARQAGIPIVAVAAMYQVNPVGVMVHKSQPWTSWKDLTGKTWVVQTGELGQEWVTMHDHLKYSTIAYQGSIAAFLHNPSLVQQGWATNEAYTAAANGVKVRFFSYASAGYDPYNDVVFVTTSYLKSHGSVIRSLLGAGMRGWADYMGSVPVASATNDAMAKANPQMTKASEWYAWDKQRPFVIGDTSKTGGIGWMTLGRWTTTVRQMRILGAVKTPPVPSSLYTNAFLPRIKAPAVLPPAPKGSYTVPTGSYVVG